MSAYRKLSKPTDERKATLRNLVTDLLWYGKIETTEARAKEIRRIAEKLITLAKKEAKNVVEVEKQINNEKQQTVAIRVKNDMPSRLHARRQIISYVYDIKFPREKDETKAEYKERLRQIKHPLVEKLFNEIAPKYADRNGGYVRILKLGKRRGDASDMVIVELV